ncbi:MAG TPA: RDD family protein, partial [Micromonosporaceae bacterium]|nr:RDD family protein [Micromonosporaceae bacterium]
GQGYGAAPGGYQAGQPYGTYGQPPGGYGAGFGANPGSTGNRFLGGIIDFSVFFVPFLIIACAVGLASGAQTTNRLSVVSILLSFAFTASFSVYLIVMIGRTGQTLGGKVAGVKTVNHQGQLPGVGAAAIRWAVLWLPGFALCLVPVSFIGIVSLIWWTVCGLSPLYDNNRSQGWHDKVAKTVVISTK